MPRLLVMCDYFADPIWTEDGAMIELDSLPLSDASKAQLREWAAWYDRLGTDESAWTPDVEREFDTDCRRLWRRVAEELEPEYRVGYVDERTSQRVWE